MNNEDLKRKYDEVFKEGSDNFFTCNVFHEAHTIAGMDEWKDKKVMHVRKSCRRWGFSDYKFSLLCEPKRICLDDLGKTV